MRDPGGKHGMCLGSQVDKTWLWIGYVGRGEEEEGHGSPLWAQNHGPVLPMMSHGLSTWTWGKPLNLKSENFKTLKNFNFVLHFIKGNFAPPPQVVLVVKITPTTAGDERDMGLNPGSGRSPGVGSGNPLQYSCLEIFIDRGAWQAAVCGATKNRTWLSTREILNIYNSWENK